MSIAAMAVCHAVPSRAVAARPSLCIEQQIPGAEQQRPVLVIGDFEMIGGTPDTRFLSQGLASTLQFLLLSKRHVGVVSRPCLWTTLMELRVSSEEYHPQRIFADDVLFSVGANYFLTGTFLEVERSFQFRAKLEELPHYDLVLEWGMSVEYESTLLALQDLADRIADALSERPPSDRPPATLFVSCFRDEFGDGTAESMALRRDLGRFVSLVLGSSRAPRLTVTKWDSVAAGCAGSAAADLAQVAVEKDVDLVVSGTLSLKNEKLRIYPEILVAEFGTVIKLPFVEGPIEDYPLLRQRVGKSGIEYVRKIGGLGARKSIEELALDKPGPGRELAQGKELFEKGDHDLAVPFFQQTLKITPQQSEARKYLGRIYLGQGRTQEAVEQFELGAATGSQDPELFQGLGDAQFRAGEFTAAKEAYSKSLELSRNNGTAHERLGFIHQLEEDIETARHHYKQANQASPKDPGPLILLAYLDLRDTPPHFERALGYFKSALSINEGNSKAVDGIISIYRRRGQAAREAEDHVEAERQLSMEIDFRKQNERPSALPYFLRATTRAASWNPTWDIPGAITDFETVLQMKGQTDTGVDAPVEWAALGLLELYVMAERYDDAQKLGWEQIKQFSSKPFLRPVARFYRIAAMIMTGKEPGAQHEILREELASLKSSYKDQDYMWDFDNFFRYVETSENFKPNQRSSILKLALLLKEADPGRKK